MNFNALKFLIVFIFALGITGCSVVDDGITSIKPSPDSEYSADPSSDPGSRNNPIALGNPVIVNDWKVRVISVNADAYKKVSELDAYTSQPSSRERFLLINVKATFIGEESGEPSSDLRFKIVGAKGNTFTQSCGYYSGTFDDQGETFQGASVSGSICFTVDIDQIDGAAVSIQGEYGSDDRKFLSITP